MNPERLKMGDMRLSSVHKFVDTLDPSTRPAEGGAGSVGPADGCDPKAGYGVPINPRAYVYLRGRIPMRDIGPLLLASAHPLSRAERGANGRKWFVNDVANSQ